MKTWIKREYNKRVLQVEHDTFTPLIFSTFDGIGFEGQGNRFIRQFIERKNIRKDGWKYLSGNELYTNEI